MTSAEEGWPPSNDPEEWQDTYTAKCILQSASCKVQILQISQTLIKEISQTCFSEISENFNWEISQI